MKAFKKIGAVLADVLIVLVFLVSVVLIIANITSDKENGGQPNVFGYVINSVQSDSMAPTFSKGALVIGKLVDENTVIQKDTIITFPQKVGGVTIKNTHRVVDTNTSAGTTLYQTQGDNREECPTPDQVWKTRNDIIAVYVGHIPFVGGFIDFLKEPLGFVLILVLPIVAFIAWQAYKLIALYIASKKEEMAQQAKEGVSDEAKDAIIKEYLAQMEAQKSAEQQDAPKSEDGSDSK